MNAEEKTTLARFLDLAGDCLRDGHARHRDDYAFEDDAQEAPKGFSSLPLAYQMDEEAALGEEAGEQSVSLAGCETLEDLAAAVRACETCGLCATRTHAVPGEGPNRPLAMVIGEGPGADEDATGRPFVGRAGQLLDKMLASVALYRDKNCFIANIVKCRPPKNRDPQPEEIAACIPFLKRQIMLLRPRVILCAGRVAAQSLLGTGQGINALRGTFASFSAGGEAGEAVPVLCTFHPSAILRNEDLKRPAWEDLKLLKARLDSITSLAPSGETGEHDRAVL
ncbi:MAG: uracil-DNA glycosylase [Treponema sp.]|nr:uracil-DNA glycosylase [Treponema sp.]